MTKLSSVFVCIFAVVFLMRFLVALSKEGRTHHSGSVSAGRTREPGPDSCTTAIAV